MSEIGERVAVAGAVEDRLLRERPELAATRSPTAPRQAAIAPCTTSLSGASIIAVQRSTLPRIHVALEARAAPSIVSSGHGPNSA